MEPHKYKLRDARDSLVDMLYYPLHTIYPIPDLPVTSEHSTVLFNAPARIIIPFSQADVTYEVIDDSGSKNTRKITRNDNEVIIETRPLLKDDYTFSVIATKTTSGLSKQLLQTVIVKAGVNNTLEVLLKEPVFDFGSHASVIVKDTQPGAKYQLYDLKEVPLSPEVKSVNGGDVELITTDPVTEDIKVIIWATSIKTGYYDSLITKPEIVVYPDVSLIPSLKEDVIDYNSKATILLSDTQKSVEYTLIFEDIDDDTVNKSEWIGKALGEPVKGNGRTILLPINDGKEDLTVSIVARKIKSGHSKRLPAETFQVIKVRPDPEKEITLVRNEINVGDSATVRVANTQRGIIYQLRNIDNNLDVGLPQYHHRNYPIGKARIGFEFAIGRFEQDFVELQTGPLETTTTFNVVAIKATTKEEAQVGEITVTVK